MKKLKTIGKIKEAKTFSKDIILIRAFAILMKDEHGQVIYTFETKKEADECYRAMETLGSIKTRYEDNK